MNAHEREHISFVRSVFETYGDTALATNQRRRADYEALPAGHAHLLEDYPALLERIDEAIRSNAEMLKLIASHADDFLQPVSPNLLEFDMDDAPEKRQPNDGDYERLRSVLRQVVREWTTLGRIERDVSFKPMIDRLIAYADERTPDDRSDLQVLIPGAGLGRLVWEVANAGFAASGCECSMYMLFVGNACLNLSSADSHTFYPFVHSLSNIISREDLLTPLSFPDITASEMREGSNGSMSMAAGDFVDVYSRPESEGAYDAILTCFFLDTATNIVSYLDTIRHALANDGIWINLGPLLWHHEHMHGEPSIELTLDGLTALCKRMGFVFDVVEGEEVRMLESAYTANPRSMLRYQYSSAFFACRKWPVSP